MQKRANTILRLEPGKMTLLFLLGVFCLLPSFQTVVSVCLEWHTAATYPLLKAIMIAIPLIVWLKSGRSKSDIRERLALKRTNALPGLCTGVLMGGIILAGYYLLLRPVIDPSGVIGKVRSLGLTKHYWIMALVISLWNALFEEYYWRGFIISELRGWSLTVPALCVIGGVLFGLHHIFVAVPLFAWAVGLLCAAGTMVAGGIWTWMRLRGHSILDCYVSHVLADLAVMWAGYDLLRTAS